MTTSGPPAAGTTPRRSPGDISSEAIAAHVESTRSILDARRDELVEGLRFAIKAGTTEGLDGIDRIAPKLPSPEEIESAAVDLRVSARLGSTARTIRRGQPLGSAEPGVGEIAVRPTIEIDLGTVSFVYDFARALAEFVTESGDPIAVASVDPKAVAALVERMRYATDWYVSRLPMAGVLPLQDVPAWRKLWAAEMAIAAERFVIAHELGHALLHGSGRAKNDAESRAREREADLFGLRLVLVSDRGGEHPSSEQFAYGGVFFYLAILELSEAYTDHRTSDTTHPHADDRAVELASIGPAFGISITQLELVVKHIDVTFKDLSDAVWARRPSAKDPDHEPHTYSSYILDVFANAVLLGAMGKGDLGMLRRLVLAGLQKWPSIVVAVLRDLATGQIRDANVDTASYVRASLLPALPPRLRDDLLSIPGF